MCHNPADLLGAVFYCVPICKIRIPLLFYITQDRHTQVVVNGLIRICWRFRRLGREQCFPFFKTVAARVPLEAGSHDTLTT